MTNRAEEDGDTALTGTPPAVIASSSADSLTAKPRGRPFVAGDDSRRNPHGRPRKGESLPERLHREYERKQKQLVTAAINRALREDQVGNRAFADGLDRAYGKVADEMHITMNDSPLALLFADADVRQAVRQPYVEGEARDITDAVSVPQSGPLT